MIEAVRKSTNKGNLQEVFNIMTMLEERMKKVHNITMIYKLASVYFIGENENAYEYDEQYNEQKIKSWVENKTFDDFFLSSHMQDLLPSFEAYKTSFLSYFKGENIQLKNQLKHFLSMVKSEDTANGLTLKLSSQIKMLEELVEKI
jgi:hypothetical protein